MQRDKIIDFADGYLNSKNIKDASQNGLQFEGAPEVKKIAFGVSASLELIKKAAAWRADLIIVHHGLLWGKSQPFRGPFKQKLELLLKSGMSLAAWHLPLDKHPVVGNNARLLNILAAKKLKPFGTYDGEIIGLSGVLPKPQSAGKIAKTLSCALMADALCYSFGPESVKTVGVISGGAQRMFDQAIEAGLDLYVTGEVSEFVQEMARENKINFIAAGHYNTEKTGVWALEKLLRSKFKVETLFIDVPNPV